MKKLDVAMFVLLVGSCAALTTSAAGAPVSSGLRATAVDRGVILISDCETDDEGNTYCPEQPPQYEKPKKRSNTQKFLDALQRAAEQAAAKKRERDRQRAIQAEERRRQKAAEKERRRKKAAAEKERRRREAAAEKKRKQKQAEKAERDRKRRQAEADKKAKEDATKAADDKAGDDKATAGAPPMCDGKTCAGGEYLDGDCRCVKGGEGGTTEVTTLDGNPVTVVIGPTDEFPPPSTIPDSICQLKIGNTTIFCDGYLPGLPPTRTSCRGRTENGCYLRPVTVRRLDGESGEACMQFCINKRPPPVITEGKPPKRPKAPPVVAKDPGKPAVPTGTATVYREPQRPKTPAVKTGTATVYVWPKPRATPAVKTATAATRVWPKLPLTPAVQTAIAAKYVEP